MLENKACHLRIYQVIYVEVAQNVVCHYGEPNIYQTAKQRRLYQRKV